LAINRLFGIIVSSRFQYASAWRLNSYLKHA
jgi:hypothetical protein